MLEASKSREIRKDLIMSLKTLHIFRLLRASELAHAIGQMETAIAEVYKDTGDERLARNLLALTRRPLEKLEELSETIDMNKPLLDGFESEERQRRWGGV